MRHSDPKLAAKAYLDQGALPLAEFVAKIPGMPNGKPLSPISSLDSGFSGPFASSPVLTEEPKPSPQATLNELLSRLLSHLGAACPMAPAVGIEPTVAPLSVNGLGDLDSLPLSPDCRLLLKVAAAWPRLNGSLKLAILAIVDSASPKQEIPAIVAPSAEATAKP